MLAALVTLRFGALSTMNHAAEKCLAQPPKDLIDRIVRKDDWNDYVIRCVGNKIEIFVNGEQTVDYTETDPAIETTGVIALANSCRSTQRSVVSQPADQAAVSMQTPSPIEFVYFDLGNVLARFDVERACRNVANRWNVDAALVREALWTSGMQDRFEHGHEDDESFARWTRQSLKLDEATAPTRELLDQLSDMFDPIVEMESVVNDVRDSGMKLGILSNTCGAHWRWLLDAKYPSLRGPFDQLSSVMKSA
jgi:hypothetical protein